MSQKFKIDPKDVEDGPTSVSEPNVLGGKHSPRQPHKTKGDIFSTPQRDHPTKSAIAQTSQVRCAFEVTLAYNT